MSTETIRIPLRGGDLTLTQNDAPDEDGFVTFTDPEADMHITLPVSLLDRLSEVGDVVTIWPPQAREALHTPDDRANEEDAK